MKKQYLFWIFLVILPLSSFAQAGFLGKRVHFQFESKFTPAWSNLNFNHKQGAFRFNYNLMPSVEYILDDRWSISAHYQYSPSAFKIGKPEYNFQYSETGYFMETGNRYSGYNNGDMTIHGVGFNASYYFSKCAPAGYYIKFGMDAFFYNVSVSYSGYDTLMVTQTGPYSEKKEYVFRYSPGVYTANDWALGARFENGRNFFIGRYVSLGTSLSCGVLFKGWFTSLRFDREFINSANKRLLTSYIGGISIKIGILPF